MKEKCSLKPLDELRNLLGLEVDEDLDVNEFIHKLFGKILNDEVHAYHILVILGG